jgi:hypothetical protein
MTKLGATGNFPDGKISDDDEGELTMAVREEKGMVRLDFGKPVAWLMLPPDSALEFAMAVTRHACRLSGKNITITVE